MLLLALVLLLELVLLLVRLLLLLKPTLLLVLVLVLVAAPSLERPELSEMLLGGNDAFAVKPGGAAVALGCT